MTKKELLLKGLTITASSLVITIKSSYGEAPPKNSIAILREKVETAYQTYKEKKDITEFIELLIQQTNTMLTDNSAIRINSEAYAHAKLLFQQTLITHKVIKTENKI